jgi:hypothetical protein
MTDRSAGWDPPHFPSIRLRVGACGHREAPQLPGAALAAVRASVDRVLFAITQATRQHAGELDTMLKPRSRRNSPSAGPQAERCAVICQLAEGADRIVAQAGLAAGFSLEAILPFAKAEFIKDFATAESRAEFGGLLDRAASVFALDGCADERPRAYEAAGFVMLANVDLLIAIWDGTDAKGVGGTGQIVSAAIADRIPVVWIDPAHPDALQMSWSLAAEGAPVIANPRSRDMFQATDLSSLAQAIAKALFPTLQEGGRRALETYLDERERRWNLCPWFPLLLWAFAGRVPRWDDFRLPAFLADTRAQWSNYFAVLPGDKAQRPAIETLLLPAYSGANHLSVYYSLLYRSTYVFSYLFAAIAVMLALGGIFIHDPHTKSYLVLAELVIIAVILFTWLRGHRQQWHQRWLDYRRLAESLRHMRILGPLGSLGPIDRPGRRLMVDEQDWVHAYAWSLRRLLPLPDCTIDEAYLAAVRDTVRSAEIAGQLEYHIGNQKRMHRLDHRMHAAGQWLFGITGALCLLFLVVVWIVGIPHGDHSSTEHILGAFTFTTALLPTLGSALGAIHFQGDFKTVAGQSRRTALRLVEIDKALANEPLAYAKLTDRIEKVSDVMMADHLEWQTIFRTRPLSLPA